MITSIRRITSSLLISGLLLFTVATTQQLLEVCIGGDSSCLVSAVTFGVSAPEVMPAEMAVTQSETTPAIAPDTPTISGLVIDVIQVTSVYLILLSVMVLVVLEAFELRYLRRLMKAA